MQEGPPRGAFLPSAVTHFYSGQPMHFYSGVDNWPVRLGSMIDLAPVERTRTRERTGDISVMPFMISFTYSGGAR